MGRKKDGETTVSVNGGPEVPIDLMMAAAKAIESKTRRVELTREVKRTLSEDEVIERARTMAEKMREYSRTEEELKTYTKEKRADLERLHTEVGLLCEAVRTGSEYVETRCTLTLDYEQGTAITYVTETGEIVESRVMSDSERQMTI